MKTKAITLSLLAASLLTFAACASKIESKKTTADDAEYEYVTPIGSHIPVKVRKGAAKPQVAAPTGEVSGEDAQTLIHAGGGPVKDGGR
jgi:uncharacterized lipoprotein